MFVTSCYNAELAIPRPVIVIGAGGHAAVVISSLLRLGADILGATTKDCLSEGTVLGVDIIGTDEKILAENPEDIVLANGIGATLAGQTRRYVCAEEMRTRGYLFCTLIDPSVVCGPEVNIGDGVQIMAGTVIQPRTNIGADCIINTGARIDHDCEIGINCHVYPGATLAGGVHIGPRTIIGAGVTVIPGVTIGADSLIAAGSIITGDVPPNSRVNQKSKRS